MYIKRETKERHCLKGQKDAQIKIHSLGVFWQLLFALGVPGGSGVKNLTTKAGGACSIPGSGRSRDSYLENPLDKGEPGKLLSMGSQKSDMTECTHIHIHSLHHSVLETVLDFSFPIMVHLLTVQT